MSRWTYLAMLAPAAYFGLMSAHQGVRAQLELALARTPEAFSRVLAEHGGRGAVRTGVLIDLGFVALFLVVAGYLLVRADLPWWPAVAAAALDLLQNLLLVVATGREPGSTLRLALLVTTIAMFLAYALTLAALLVGCVRAR